MTTELARPTDLSELLKDKVREEFLKIIPEEAWENMVTAAWDDFFKKKDRGYHNPKTSDFELMVNSQLTDLMKAKLFPILEAKVNEINYADKADEVIQTLCKNVGPTLLDNFTYHLVSSVMLQIRNDMQQYGMNMKMG